MLYRKAETEINKWIKDMDCALLVTGARQVGKTYIIRECLKNSGYDVLEINLVKQPQYLTIFNSLLTRNINDFIESLSLIAQKTLNKSKTIIFIDEVQECKEILTAIKFLVEDNTYKYVLSGSLLGVELVDLRSAPVGYLRTIEMFPLDFEEFLIANGLENKFIKQLKENFEKKTPILDILHEKVLDAFHKYLIIGGMPKAVQKYIETNDYIEVSEIHKEIIKEYLVDFTKYENNKSLKLKLRNIYNLIPSELNSHNKRYIFTHLDKNLKMDRYENSFNWLIDAGVALPVFNTTEVKVPLEINKKANIFKLFLSDVGLLTTLYGTSTILKLLSKEKDINYGAVYENFVCQELRAHGYKQYFYNSKKYGELDFVIEHMGEVVPIEVKSGKDYKVHSALNNVKENNVYSIKQAFVLSNFNISNDGIITYYPIYMTMFIDERSIDLPKIEKIDFSILNN